MKAGRDFPIILRLILEPDIFIHAGGDVIDVRWVFNLNQCCVYEIVPLSDILVLIRQTEIFKIDKKVKCKRSGIWKLFCNAGNREQLAIIFGEDYLKLPPYRIFVSKVFN
jgi:hypothetical protein